MNSIYNKNSFATSRKYIFYEKKKKKIAREVQIQLGKTITILIRVFRKIRMWLCQAESGVCTVNDNLSLSPIVRFS